MTIILGLMVIIVNLITAFIMTFISEFMASQLPSIHSKMINFKPPIKG